jgi:hypothetical protein
MPKRKHSTTAPLLQTTDSAAAVATRPHKRAKLSREERLEKYKITPGDYATFTTNLAALGYSLEQSDRLIVRKSSKNTLLSLCTLHDELVGYGFNHVQLVRIAAHDGGSLNLKELKALAQDNGPEGLWTKLTSPAFGFKAEHFVNILANNGGSLNLKELKALAQDNGPEGLWTKLTSPAFGFKAEHFVRILAHGGGSLNLKELKALAQDNGPEGLWTKLTSPAFGFKAEHFVRILAHGGGSLNLKAVVKHIDAIIATGIPASIVVGVVKNKQGRNRLIARLHATPRVHSPQNEAFGMFIEELNQVQQHNNTIGFLPEPEPDNRYLPPDMSLSAFLSYFFNDDMPALPNNVEELHHISPGHALPDPRHGSYDSEVTVAYYGNSTPPVSNPQDEAMEWEPYPLPLSPAINQNAAASNMRQPFIEYSSDNTAAENTQHRSNGFISTPVSPFHEHTTSFLNLPMERQQPSPQPEEASLHSPVSQPHAPSTSSQGSGYSYDPLFSISGNIIEAEMSYSPYRNEPPIPLFSPYSPSAISSNDSYNSELTVASYGNHMPENKDQDYRMERKQFSPLAPHVISQDAVASHIPQSPTAYSGNFGAENSEQSGRSEGDERHRAPRWSKQHISNKSLDNSGLSVWKNGTSFTR